MEGPAVSFLRFSRLLMTEPYPSRTLGFSAACLARENPVVPLVATMIQANKGLFRL